MNAEEFVEKYLLEEVRVMEAANVRLHLLMAMLQGVETAGAFLDDKPFKAKGQGRKRFQLALSKLFPKSYSEANSKIDLYGQLRSHMAHCMLPAVQVRLDSELSNHLKFREGILYFSIEAFYSDYELAMKKLLEKLRSGELKNKKIILEGIAS
ncbi:MAG: hypothetical protein H6601_03540 [Flavobacteriales bacterium]|nr:hypothetical protein [Flavobacteriales bacterium]